MAATKKQTKGSLTASGITYIIIGVICAVVGIITLIGNASYMISGECKELTDYMDSGVYPVGEYVHVDINYAFGTYAELKHTTNGIPTGTDEFFLVCLEDGTVFSLKIKDKSGIDALNKITDATDQGSTAASYSATGKLKNITDKEQLQYYRETCEGAEDLGFTVKELDIDCTDSRGSLWGMFALFTGLGVVLLIVGLATLKKAKNFNNTPITDYSNSDYTPVDTTAEYNPVDTSVPYEGDSQDPNNYQ